MECGRAGVSDIKYHAHVTMEMVVIHQYHTGRYHMPLLECMNTQLLFGIDA